MSLKIDPNSVHLGKNATGVVDNIYDARYIGATGATGSCTLPPEIPYTPGNFSLIPLQPSCTFNFTDVLELPPLPTPPPPASFRGCETLSASTSIITTNATKNTSLSLVAGGPFPGETGTNDCTLKLVGVIDVDACTNFTATSAVNFSNAAAGSSLTITAASIPNCGFDLRGNINIAACETFAASSNITFNNALRGSYLTLTPSSLPNCGLDISGNLNVEACETFSASSSVSFTGNAVKRSSFSVSPSSTPNCGFTLNGDVVIEACTDFSASGGITFSGKAVKSSSVTVTASQQPNCGFVLNGNVEIDACATFTAVNNLKIYGQSVNTITPIYIQSVSTPDCGFILNGELSIDACSSVSTEIVPDALYPSYITLYTNVPPGQPPDRGEVFSYSPLILRSRPITQSGCDSVIALSLDPIDLELPSSCCPIIKPYTPGTMTGCCWDEDTNGPFLYKDEYTNEMYIGGTLPTPCFVCDTTITAPGTLPFVYSDVTLNSIEVNYLTGTNCCTSPTYNQINLCSGIIQFSNPKDSTQLYQNSQYITLTAPYAAANIAANGVVLTESYKKAEFESGSITLENTSLANTYMYGTASGLYVADSGYYDATLTANYLELGDAGSNYVQVNASAVQAGSPTGSRSIVRSSGVTVYDGSYSAATIQSNQIAVGPSQYVYASMSTSGVAVSSSASNYGKLTDDSLYIQGTSNLVYEATPYSVYCGYNGSATRATMGIDFNTGVSYAYAQYITANNQVEAPTVLATNVTATNEVNATYVDCSNTVYAPTCNITTGNFTDIYASYVGSTNFNASNRVTSYDIVTGPVYCSSISCNSITVGGNVLSLRSIYLCYGGVNYMAYALMTNPTPV